MIIVPNYKLGKTVGSGTFGTVRLATHVVTQTKVAIKTIVKEKIIAENLVIKTEREIRSLELLRHPHLVRVYESILDKKYVHVIMEFVPGGELFDQIEGKGKMPESVARTYFQQLISCIEYTHNCGIAHRDLKPENILLDENMQVKLADFGLCNRMRDGCFLLTSCGSPNYAAPEIVSGKAYCGSEVDIWSLGIILYAMLSATLPFDDQIMSRLFMKIRSGKFFMPAAFSPEVKNLLHSMINVDPTTRITIPEIKKHPWYTERLPFYLEVMDNTKLFKQSSIDLEILAKILNFAEYTAFDKTEIMKDIREEKKKDYYLAYEMLLSDKEKKRRLELLNKKVQMTFDIKNFTKVIKEENKKSEAFHFNFGVASGNTPFGIIKKILKTVENMGCRWKFRSPKYVVVARKKISSTLSEENMMLKVEISMYMNQASFVIDLLKKDQYSVMHFLDFCAEFQDRLLVCQNQSSDLDIIFVGNMVFVKHDRVLD